MIIRIYLVFLATAFFLNTTAVASAAVIRQGGNAPKGSYAFPVYGLGYGRAASYLTVSTLDGWQTVSLDFEVQSNATGFGANHRFNIAWGGIFDGINKHEDIFRVSSDPLFVDYPEFLSSQIIVGDGSKFSAILGSTAGSVWELVSSGDLYIQHCNFGDEYCYAYYLIESDRNLQSSTYGLNEPSAIPLPASVVFLLFSLLLLRGTGLRYKYRT